MGDEIVMVLFSILRGGQADLRHGTSIDTRCR
jgi:hypothetical protein